MKRLAAFAALVPLLLTGCGHIGGLDSNFRTVEDLQLVQTLGADAERRGLILSAAAARMPGEAAPLLLRRSAVSIPGGMDALQMRTPRGQLYFAHTQFIVMGQAFACVGVNELLDFVERDVFTRMGAALFVVRGGSAEALITGSGSDWDVNDMLTAVRAETDRRGAVHVFDVRETAVALSESGAALVCAVRAAETQGSVFGLSPGSAAVPDGYGILRGGALIGFLDGDGALAASLVLGVLGTVTREIGDGSGGTVTAEVRCGAPKLDFSRRADGGVRLTLRAAPEAMLASVQSAGRCDPDKITEAVNAALRNALERTLARSADENADFLALGLAMRRQGIDPAELPPDWLRTLETHVTVETVLRHGYDLDLFAGTGGGAA